ncbi:MAG: NAD(P)-binding protein [Proteobacteria bacterium]|nr:NAD(P)-binding protein [Pseudomonadota bacterium]
MRDGITRRDFLNGVALAITGAGSIEWMRAAAEPTSAQADSALTYPPLRTGLRGSHVGSFEAAHRLRDGQPFDLSGAKVEEHYDLIVVGGGISGLASAYFYRQRKPGAKILILETNDDFGGHAKRNEFDVDGRMLLGYGGTQSIDSPRHHWSKAALGLLADLNVDLDRFKTAFDQGFYARWALNHAVFFGADAFGVNRLVRQPFGQWGDWDEKPTDAQAIRQYVEQFPLNERARAQLVEMWTSQRDVLAAVTPERRQQILEHTSYRDFLTAYWNADADVLKFLQKRTHGLWAIGIDAVPASETLTLPGMQAQRQIMEKAGAFEKPEPYIYHFPDGNASIARLLVRQLIPGIAPGRSMEDIVTARFDYSRLDLAEQDVRIRLRCTAVEVRNAGKGVNVAYVRDGKPTRAAARDCVLACYHAMMPYIAPELPAPQKAAMHANVRAPLVYVNVAVRNWKPWQQLGVAYIANVGGMFDAYLDFPVSLGNYRFAADPTQPVCIHMEYMPCAPNQGLDMREQYRIGRSKLYSMSFTDFERHIREELGAMLQTGGFEFDRDVAAITVNRWPHGYAYTPTPLYDDPEQAERLARVARKRVGRIAIANSDSGWDAYTHVAIEQAHRAVGELV